MPDFSEFSAPLPPNEADRLKTLHSYDLLDTPPEPQFDRLTQLAASICGTPIALMSLLDETRQWFKSKVGIDVEHMPRNISFCQYALPDTRLLEVEDATKDARFVANPLVTADPHIRFYAGQPLIMPNGHVLGTLCVIDRVPRTLTESQRESLRLLAEELVYNILARQEHRALKEAQRHVEQQKNELEGFFQTSVEFLCTADLQGNFVKVNKAWEDFLGIPAQKLAGESFLQFVHPEDITGTLEATERLEEGKNVINFTNRYRAPSGEYRWVEWHATAKDGLVYAAARDVSGKIAAEKQLRQSEQHSRSLLDLQTCYVIRTDLEGCYTYANQRFLQTFDLAQEDIDARRLSVLSSKVNGAIVAEDVPKLEKATVALLESPGQPVQVDLRKLLPNGQIAYILWDFSCVLNTEGKPHEIQCVGIDYTERYLAEEQLKRTTTLLNDAQRIAKMGAWELDLTTGRTFWTDEVYAIHEVARGFDHNKVNGIEFYHPDDQPIIAQAIGATIEQQIPFDVKCRFITAKRNHHRWVRASGYPVVSEGKVTHLIGMFQDITQEVADKEMLQRNEAQFRFIAENTSDGITVMEHGKITYLSKVYERIMGYTLAEEQVRDEAAIFELVHPDDREWLQRHIAEQLAKKKNHLQYVYRIRHKEGYYLWREDKVTLQYDEQGVPIKPVIIASDITQRKEQELALADKTERLDAIIKGTNVGTWEWNVQTGETIFNARWAEMIGYTLEELSPISIETWMHFAHPDDLEKSSALLQQHFSGELAYYECESRMKHKDGHWIWVLDTGKVFSWTTEDQPLMMYGTHQDVSRRKYTEQQLLESRQKLESIFNEMTDVVYSRRYPDFKVTFVTPSVERLYGHSAEAWSTMDGASLWRTFIHPADAGVLANIQAQLAEKEMFEQDYRIVTANKEVKWLRHKGRVIQSQDGSKRLDAHISDITFVKRTENISKAISYATAALLESPEAEVALRTSLELVGKSLEADQSFYSSIQYTDSGVFSSLEFECYADGRPPVRKNPALQHVPVSFLDEAAQQILQGKVYQNLVCNLPPDSPARPIFEAQGVKSFILFPIELHGAVRSFIGFEDLHYENTWSAQEVRLLLSFADSLATAIERNELENSLLESKQHAEEASRSKSEFLANMSHEIRTPLNSVIGFSELLMRTQMSDTQSQYIHAIHHSGNALLDLVNDILDFSKIEAGKMELSPEKTDLWQLVEQVAEMAAFKTSPKQVELLLNISPQTPRFVQLDTVRVRQILVNLLSNAVKFTEQGEIELRIAPAGAIDRRGLQPLRFAIRDTGIGIAPEKQRKIFEAFAQEDSSTTRKYGGTGLGLTICTQLLALMGSQLELESEQGAGSLFFFTVNVPIETNPQAVVWENTRGLKHLLVIEDNPNNARILQDMLAIEGITADLATDGISALRLLSKNPSAYDAAILDYHMPFMDGLAVAAQIREKLKLQPAELPILLLHSAAHDTESITHACAKWQIDVQRRKPLGILQLFEALGHLGNAQITPLAPDEQVALNDTIHDPVLLIADDNPMNRLLASNMVKQLLPRVQLVEAEDGQEALEKYLQNRPHLVLMDVQMPRMSGYEAVAHIRTHEEQVNTARVPVLALTAGTKQGERERCLAAGMDDYLSKPIDMERLQEALTAWLPSEIHAAAPAQTTPITTTPEDEAVEGRMHFNRSYLIEQLGGDDALLEKVLNMAREDVLEQQANELVELLRKGADEKYIRAQAHKLKGSGLGAGFEVLGYLSDKLEHLEPYKPETVRSLVVQIQQEVQYLRRLLNSKG